MSLLPGAEFAPILTRTIIDLGPEGSDCRIEREIRWRADVTDPDDQRAIWLRAAALEGADKEEQRSALLMRSATDPHLWILRCKSLREGPRHLARVRGETIEEATAALCAHIGGPEPLAHQATP